MKKRLLIVVIVVVLLLFVVVGSYDDLIGLVRLGDMVGVV